MSFINKQLWGGKGVVVLVMLLFLIPLKPLFPLVLYSSLSAAAAMHMLIKFGSFTRASRGRPLTASASLRPAAAAESNSVKLALGYTYRKVYTATYIAMYRNRC